MTQTNTPPVREVLLGIAAVVVSCVSLSPLFWGLFILGDYGDRNIDPFPDFLRGAVAVSFAILVIGAFAIAPFWRVSPVLLGGVASTPYLLLALTCSRNLVGFAICAGIVFLVFGVFFGGAHLCRIFSRSTVV